MNKTGDKEKPQNNEIIKKNKQKHTLSTSCYLLCFSLSVLFLTNTPKKVYKIHIMNRLMTLFYTMVLSELSW